jgi:hypothetical protein
MEAVLGATGIDAGNPQPSGLAAGGTVPHASAEAVAGALVVPYARDLVSPHVFARASEGPASVPSLVHEGPSHAVKAPSGA